jgi:hypothetical protein
VRSFLSLLICLFLISTASDAAPFGKSKSNVTPTTATVTANLASPGNVVPTNFVGLSVEAQAVYVHNILNNAGTPSLLSLLQLLGTGGVIHIGGLSSDGCDSSFFTTANANAIGSFVSSLGSNWNLFYYLPDCSPSAIVAWVTDLVNAFGLSKMFLAEGNEGNWNVSNFNAMYAAVTAVYPTAKFICCGGNDSSEATIETTTPGVAGLYSVEVHNYPNCGGFVNETILLNCFDTPEEFASTSAYDGNTTSISEYSSDTCGGIPGFSDRMYQSAFFIDYLSGMVYSHILFTNASFRMDDVSGCGPNLNPVGAGNIISDYTPAILLADGNWTAGPGFAGLFLFSKLEGQTTVSTTISGSSNVQAIATIGPHGNANILVVNNDMNIPVTITPAQSNSWSTATYLDAQPATKQGCFDVNALVGGSQIGESGAWNGTWKTIANGGTIVLQPCGAALIEIQP